MKHFAIFLIAAYSGTASASLITYSDRPSFDAAVDSTVVEDFGVLIHLGIASGILNSSTSEGTTPFPISPGDIKPGVTYSTTVGPEADFFNIDSGGGFSGGFLDSVTPGGPTRTLTATFDTPEAAFGFDTNLLMGNFSVLVSFASGPNSSFAYPVSGLPPGPLSFYGFQSDAVDITSVQIHGDDGQIGFVLDNFTFGGSPSGAAVPEAGSGFGLLAMGLGGLLALGAVGRLERKPI